MALNTEPDDLLDLDDALAKLASEYAQCAEPVKLRFFAGMSLGDVAAALGLPRRTADRHWAFARAWLHRQLSGDTPSGPMKLQEYGKSVAQSWRQRSTDG